MADPLTSFLALLDSDASWRAPEAFRWRADAADRLDLLLATSSDDALRHRADAMLDAMDALDQALFASLRQAIHEGRGRETLAPWLDADDLVGGSSRPTASFALNPPTGAHYDTLDALLSGILSIHEPRPDDPRPPPNMVFYQPTPARHIVEAIRRTALSADDHVLDLGSGLGHVPILVRLLSDARASGVERDPAYVTAARAAAEGLGLPDVSFTCEDARQVDLSQATVLYLFTPFIGDVLRDVLIRIEAEARKRPLRLLALGPVTRTLSRHAWLRTDAPIADAPDQIVLYQSR